MREDLDIDSLKQSIQTSVAEIKEIVVRTEDRREAVELDQTRQGRVSRQDALMQQEMAKAAHVRRKTELIRLEQALDRIETEDYGYCINCDEEISKPRIENDPAVTLCIKCAM